jgi:hypothetical protein
MACQRWRPSGSIILVSGKVVGVTFNDRHLLEGVGEDSGGQHASYATAKNHCLPAPIHRRPGS